MPLARFTALPGELAGLTAAVAEAIQPHLRFGEATLRLGLPEPGRAPVAAALASERPGPVLLLVATPANVQDGDGVIKLNSLGQNCWKKAASDCDLADATQAWGN